MHEFKLAEDSDRGRCKQFAETIEQAGGKLVPPLDYTQFDYPTDQIYLDYLWHGQTITLHLEHYLGIFLLSEELTKAQLAKVWEEIKSYT